MDSLFDMTDTLVRGAGHSADIMEQTRIEEYRYYNGKEVEVMSVFTGEPETPSLESSDIRGAMKQHFQNILFGEQGSIRSYAEQFTEELSKSPDALRATILNDRWMASKTLRTGDVPVKAWIRSWMIKDVIQLNPGPYIETTFDEMTRLAKVFQPKIVEYLRQVGVQYNELYKIDPRAIRDKLDNPPKIKAPGKPPILKTAVLGNLVIRTTPVGDSVIYQSATYPTPQVAPALTREQCKAAAKLIIAHTSDLNKLSQLCDFTGSGLQTKAEISADPERLAWWRAVEAELGAPLTYRLYRDYNPDVLLPRVAGMMPQYPVIGLVYLTGLYRRILSSIE